MSASPTTASAAATAALSPGAVAAASSPIQPSAAAASAQQTTSLYVSVAQDTSTEPAVIELERVQKTYLLGVEGVPALRGVSLKIRRGEFLAIYGTSGGGKTSLLNIIGTIDKPTKGHVTICGSRITSATRDDELALIRLKKMGFVFQSFNLLGTMNAVENVEMPMILYGELTAKQRRQRARELLELVGLGERLTHMPSMMSGGEQQRCTIARAIANMPEILLLDEPTGDLDTKNTLIVMDLLMELNEREGITMIMVTHDPNLKFAADRVVYMRDGKIDRVEEPDKSIKREFQMKLRDQLATMGVEKATVAGHHGHDVQGAKVAAEAKRIKRLGKKAARAAAAEARANAKMPKPKFSASTSIREPSSYETYCAEGEDEAEKLLVEFSARKAAAAPAAEQPAPLAPTVAQASYPSGQTQQHVQEGDVVVDLHALLAQSGTALHQQDRSASPSALLPPPPQSAPRAGGGHSRQNSRDGAGFSRQQHADVMSAMQVPHAAEAQLVGVGYGLHQSSGQLHNSNSLNTATSSTSSSLDE